MSNTLTLVHTVETPAPVVTGRTHVPPASGERRRPGRIENASPELIALMRKPSNAARVRVALYDAPGFLLPAQTRRPRDRRLLLRTVVAFTFCSAMSGAALHTMLTLWG